VKYWTFLSELESFRGEYAEALPSLMREFLEANPAQEPIPKQANDLIVLAHSRASESGESRLS
jgi:hypothetical protein